MTTERQKLAVKFCETWTKIEFVGNIDNFEKVSAYLKLYLDQAKAIAKDAVSSYYSNFDY